MTTILVKKCLLTKKIMLPYSRRNKIGRAFRSLDSNWCSKVKGTEIDTEITDFIANNKNIFQLWLILPIVVILLLLKVKIFRYEMNTLHKIIKTRKFHRFIKYIIYNNFFCNRIYPPLYYIINYFKISKTKFKPFVNKNIDSTTKYAIYLINIFLKIYKNMIY